MRNRDWCVYTYRHRRAFVYVVNKLIDSEEDKAEMLKRASVHDLDKQLLYQFLDAKEAQDYHVHHKSHHPESGELTSYFDILEMVIDLESAPYTKPDKPMNAYDFTGKLLELGYIDKRLADLMYEIMHTLGIDRSYPYIEDKEVLNYVPMEESVTDEMILEELFVYVRDNKTPELDYCINKKDSFN